VIIKKSGILAGETLCGKRKGKGLIGEGQSDVSFFSLNVPGTQ